MPIKPLTPFADMLLMTGLTQLECVEYLTARGMQTSIHSVKAWCRGTYNVPERAVEEIGKLYYAITDTHAVMPPEAPAGATARRQIADELAEQFDLIVTVDSRTEDDFDVTGWIQSTRKS